MRVWAKSLGLRREVRSRFSVMTACDKRPSHLFNGKCWCKVQSPAIKGFLNVLIAISAVFMQWHPAGANCIVIFSSYSRKAMRSVDNSLTRI